MKCRPFLDFRHGTTFWCDICQQDISVFDVSQQAHRSQGATRITFFHMIGESTVRHDVTRIQPWEELPAALVQQKQEGES